MKKVIQIFTKKLKNHFAILSYFLDLSMNFANPCLFSKVILQLILEKNLNEGRNLNCPLKLTIGLRFFGKGHYHQMSFIIMTYTPKLAKTHNQTLSNQLFYFLFR